MNQSGSRRHAGLGLSPILCKLKSRCKKQSESRRRAGFPVRRLDCYEPEILQPVVVIIRVFGLVPQDYDAGIPGIKLHCAADAVGLRTGHERAARATERVYYGGVFDTARYERKYKNSPISKDFRDIKSSRKPYLIGQCVIAGMIHVRGQESTVRFIDVSCSGIQQSCTVSVYSIYT